MYNAIDLKTNSSFFKDLVPEEIIKSLPFKTFRIPVVGVSHVGYRAMVKVVYATLLEKLSPEFAAAVKSYRVNKKEKLFHTIAFEECEDVRSEI